MAKKSICTMCGYVGYPRRKASGSCLIEAILWLCFIIPGIIYTIWRLTSKSIICPKCKNTSMIPVNTPQGQKLLSEQQKQEPEK